MNAILDIIFEIYKNILFFLFDIIYKNFNNDDNNNKISRFYEKVGLFTFIYVFLMPFLMVVLLPIIIFIIRYITKKEEICFFCLDQVIHYTLYIYCLIINGLLIKYTCKCTNIKLKFYLYITIFIVYLISNINFFKYNVILMYIIFTDKVLKKCIIKNEISMLPPKLEKTCVYIITRNISRFEKLNIENYNIHHWYILLKDKHNNTKIIDSYQENNYLKLNIREANLKDLKNNFYICKVGINIETIVLLCDIWTKQLNLKYNVIDNNCQHFSSNLCILLVKYSTSISSNYKMCTDNIRAINYIASIQRQNIWGKLSLLFKKTKGRIMKRSVINYESIEYIKNTDSILFNENYILETYLNIQNNEINNIPHFILSYCIENKYLIIFANISLLILFINYFFEIITIILCITFNISFMYTEKEKKWNYRKYRFLFIEKLNKMKFMEENNIYKRISFYSYHIKRSHGHTFNYTFPYFFTEDVICSDCVFTKNGILKSNTRVIYSEL